MAVTRNRRVIDGMTFLVESDLTARTLLKFDVDKIVCRACNESTPLASTMAIRSNAIAFEFLKTHARKCLLIEGDKLDAALKGMDKNARNRSRRK